MYQGQAWLEKMVCHPISNGAASTYPGLYNLLPTLGNELASPTIQPETFISGTTGALTYP